MVHLQIVDIVAVYFWAMIAPPILPHQDTTAAKPIGGCFTFLSYDLKSKSSTKKFYTVN